MKLQKMMFAAFAIVMLICAGCKDSDEPEPIPEYFQVVGTAIVGYRADIPADISIPNGITAINDAAFVDCDRIQSVSIPRNVTYIGEKAFYGCDYLENITLGGGVTFIGKDAFVNTPKLKDVYYSGTLEQWKTVEKVDRCFAEVTVHCTNGDFIFEPDTPVVPDISGGAEDANAW